MIKVAALASSYNRSKKTLRFLETLISQTSDSTFNLDIYLLDDNSADGTAEAVKQNFPTVNLICGTGNLYWAGGMRRVWNYAITRGQYDIFLLFNDDVQLFSDSVNKIIASYISLGKPGNIVIGSTKSAVTGAWTYGGMNLKKSGKLYSDIIYPDSSQLVKCDLGHANIMLVDSATVEKIGILSNRFTHGIADYDYTLSAAKKNINVWVAPGYYGYCEFDHSDNWLPQTTKLSKRLKYLYSPKGLAYKEYLYYIRKHFPGEYVSSVVKMWLKTFFPIMWSYFKAGKR